MRLGNLLDYYASILSKDIKAWRRQLIADYVLEYNNRKIADVEAKKYDWYITSFSRSSTIAKDYAKRLDIIALPTQPMVKDFIRN